MIKPVKYTGKIQWVKQETPKVKLFRIALNGHIFEFAPGQNVVLSLPGVANEKGSPMKRVYSIASSPLTKDYLELCVAVHPPPSFSAVLGNLNVGATVSVEGPYGIFK